MRGDRVGSLSLTPHVGEEIKCRVVRKAADPPEGLVQLDTERLAQMKPSEAESLGKWLIDAAQAARAWESGR